MWPQTSQQEKLLWVHYNFLFATMREFTSVQTFAYPWDYVSAANWRKYPNEQSKHVVGVDVLRRELREGKLITERLITCKQPIPSWLQYLVGVEDRSYVREVSIIDPKGQTLTMRSVNLTMTSLLKVRETVVYKPEAENPLTATTFTQKAQIVSSYGWSNVRSRIEGWAVDRFAQNASKGKLGFDSVLQLGWSDIVTDAIDTLTDKVVFEVGHISRQILNEIDAQTSDLVAEITEASKKVIDDIEKSEVLHEINSATLDLVRDMDSKASVVLTELSKKTHEVLSEVNEKSKSWYAQAASDTSAPNDVLRSIQDETRAVVEELADKKSTIISHVDSLTSTVLKALDERALELFDKSPRPAAATHNESSFLDSLKALFKKDH